MKDTLRFITVKSETTCNAQAIKIISVIINIIFFFRKIIPLFKKKYFHYQFCSCATEFSLFLFKNIV